MISHVKEELRILRENLVYHYWSLKKNDLDVPNSKEGDQLKHLFDVLPKMQKVVEAVEEHNTECRFACEARRSQGTLCKAYLRRGQRCPDCPKDWSIEFQTSDKDEATRRGEG